MDRFPANVYFFKCFFVSGKGVMIMNFVIIGCENFRFYLRRKVFNRALPPGIAYYKNKRPPPIARKTFNGTISVWFSQLNQSFHE